MKRMQLGTDVGSKCSPWRDDMGSKVTREDIGFCLEMKVNPELIK